MGLDSIIRSGIALADKVVTILQDTITIAPWTGSDSQGGPTYGTPVSMLAIVEEKQFLRRLGNGQEVTQKAQVTIPRPIADNGTANRREPVDPRDLVVLPSGYNGPILDVNGVTDPQTHNPYMFVIILG